jgi:hypothetical protein
MDNATAAELTERPASAFELRSLSRWKAFGLHLAISAVIAAAVIALVVALWYPSAYFAAMGGATLLRLLIASTWYWAR